MAEEFVRVGDVDLCYEVLGDPQAPTVLLIMGLNLQLVWWRDDFCADLVARGFRVVRFDNRDVGRTTHFAGGKIGPLAMLTRRAKTVYTIGDMADDAAGLIEHVAPGGAHIVGVSLGSFIAQELAIRHQDLTKSVVSIMGRPGDGKTGKVSPRMMPEFFRSAPASGDAAEAMVATFRRIGSVNRTEADDDDTRVALRRSMSREIGDGGGRQFAAAITERDRTADLGKLTVPFAVIHGTRDRVIRPNGGQATAAAVNGAKLTLIDGMGHDLPRWVWPQVIDTIEETASRAEGASADG